jgi:RNA polymerase sigma factor (sigma-70 family)
VNDQTDSQLLRAYAEERSEAAFAELVRRHMDFVYSAGLRMVCDAHLAEDVTQGVFVALAKQAGQLTGHPVLSGWLHRTAQNIAAQTVRTDVRRRNREQEATAMKELLSAETDAAWEDIAPHLDAALGELNEPDRDALLLRYFERKSAREMAVTLGISDEAAQKRVNRAVDRLREAFAQRGVTVGASGLVLLITTHSVQAAPAGLALTITTATAMSGTATAAATVTTTTTIQTIAMTTLQKIAVTTTLVAAVGALIYETRQIASLQEQNAAYIKQQAALVGQIKELQSERDTAKKRQVALAEELAKVKQPQNDTEVLRLRGQVGVLKQEKATIGQKSPLNKITADPATRKLMRDQQKMGMTMLYSDLVKNLKLEPEATEKFNDLMADQVMEGIDIITQALQDKKSPKEIDQLFTNQEAALNSKLQALVGQEGLAQYQEYSKNLLNSLTVQQFSSNLTGDKEAKANKKQQLTAAMQEETRAGLVGAGLSADYQPLPMLNFRNIASEEQEAVSLNVLDGIYERVAARATGFLDEGELKKFQEFRKQAQENNRTMLIMNRKMMAPISQ